MYLTNEEKGIYITMLAKQWTDGKIPKKRLGFLVGYEWDNFSDELKLKFTDHGDYILNERLEKEREKRFNFMKKQAENGKKGGRPKESNQKKNKELDKNKNPNKPNPLKTKNPNESQKKPLEDEHEIENKGNKGKGGVGEKQKIPDVEEFIEYGIKNKPDVSIESLELKYKSWVENNWTTGSSPPRKIKNWKSTLLNTLPHLKTTENGKEPTINRQTADTIRRNSEGW
jgi:uncharacterized protein YdaU (DUF1376 family)